MRFLIGQTVNFLGESVDIIGYEPRSQGLDDYLVRDSDGVEFVVEESDLKAYETSINRPIN